MKVYIVTGESFPNGMAATNRIKCYARAIKEGGVDSEVLIFRRTEVFGKAVKNQEGKGLYEGLPYQYIGGTTLRDKSLLIRQINDMIDLWRMYRYLNKNIKKGDVLLLYMGGNVRLMLRFMKIAHGKGAYCVSDLCELPYGTGAETSRAIRMRKLTTERQFPKLDGIISISDALMNYAKVYASSTCKHIKVPIMVEYEHYAIEKNQDNTKTPYIFHAGTLYQQKDGILGMIEAFGIAKQRLQMPIKYILTGSVETSSHPAELKNIIKKYQLEDSLEFVGYLYRDQVKEYLREATLVISNRPKSQQDYYGFSTKVGEYLASGTSLITTRWGEAMNWLTDKENAYIVEPEDTEALANAIVYVFQNREEARRIGLAGQIICQQCFDYHNWSKPLVDFFHELGRSR